LEAWVPFERELSILAVRAADGARAFYPLTENHHQQGCLRLSLAPARASGELSLHAEAMVTALLDELEYVGVLALELFEHDGRLLANELAPRVHNSGHWTIEGAETSQFENHLRAITGLPLGSTRALGTCAMLNLLGSVPPAERVLAVPGAHLHVYGKQPAPGRKLGHVTVRARNEAELRQRLQQLAERLEFVLPDAVNRWMHSSSYAST
ncbi:MAG: ATP-grasp domain-containing protein, partial [Planctomycetes bacterium]|nr:ATP-grasp domain-containing protein [Planctomycetota bacterium]